MMRNTSGWWVVLASAALAGCGDYKVTFRVQDAINTGGEGPANAEMLDVDVVALAPDDAERHSDIVNGSVTSAAWFRARHRDPGGANIANISGKQVFALRGTDDYYNNYMPDTRRGGPLVPVAAGGERERTIDVKHPQFLDKKAALVIYGRFQDAKGGLAETAPLIIQPPPAWNTTIVIDVGPTNMTRIEKE